MTTLTREQLQALNPRRSSLSVAALDLWEACPAAGVFSGPGRPTHGGMWYGIFVHRFLEYAVNKGHAAAVKYIQTKAASGQTARRAAETCLRIDLDALPKMAEAEVTLAHDQGSDTVRRLLGRHERPCPTWEVASRIDMLFHDADGVPHIVDWKTGTLPYGGDAAVSPQTAGLGLAVAREAGVPATRASLVGVEKTGALRWRTVELDAELLRNFRERLQTAHAHAREARLAFWANGTVPEFRPGPQCADCPALRACPVAQP